MSDAICHSLLAALQSAGGWLPTIALLDQVAAEHRCTRSDVATALARLEEDGHVDPDGGAEVRLIVSNP